MSLERGTLLLAAILFGSGIATVLAASTGTFRFLAPLLWVVWALVPVSFFAAAVLRRLRFEGDWGDLAALAIALVMAFSAGAFHHHYYATQADIGFYVTDAMATATTGSRILHGPYDGLLPGFTFTDEGAKASAMFGYSSLGAMFAYAFGMFATPWVNAPLAFLGVLALYRVARNLAGPIGATIAILLWSTSLLTVWMSRWTMTENAAIPAFWISVLLTLHLWKKWDLPRATVLLVSLLFGALVRPDGILILAWFPLLLLVRYRLALVTILRLLRRDPRYKREARITLVATAAAVAVLVPLGFILARALPLVYLQSAARLASGFFRHGVIADSHDVPTSGPSPNWGDYALRFEWDSSVPYFLPWILLIGLIGLVLRLVPWRRALLIALFCAPYLIFVFMPPVTTAHPWFMRRLWMVLIPYLFVLAGSTLDLKTVAWRWPERLGRGVEAPRPIVAAVAFVVALLFIALNAQMTLPVAFKREQDSVEPTSHVILDFVPAGAAVIIDEEVVEYASAVRFHHDGPVVPWFNARALSFFASIRASDEANSTVIIRIPASNRNFIDVDAQGAVRAEFHNATIENTVRRDFRNYIARPPLAQGYAPLGQYLQDSVPPNEWVVATQTFQMLETSQPTVIQKNVQFDPEDWERGPLGLVAKEPQSALTIDLSKFRRDILDSAQLFLHMVYVQTGTDARTITVPGRAEPLGVMESDGSQTLRDLSIPLPSPMTVSTIHLPAGTVVRGILMDLR